MKRFEWIEHPSDIGFRAYGHDLSEAFENAALALFEIMTDTSRVELKEERKIEIEAEDEGALLYDWIDKLLYLHDAEHLLLSKFEVRITRSTKGLRLVGRAWGERFDVKRHEERTAVKAMTYHMMDIRYDRNGCSVQAVVDI